jgi:Uma2 family endonuclease
VIIEVLSPSTKSYDRGDKFAFYRAVSSLRDYLLFDPETPHVEHFSRQADNSWLLRETDDAGATVAIPSLSIDLPLRDIYY